MSDTTDLENLARQTLDALDKQQEYYHAPRDTPQKQRLLRDSKRLERDLRERCDEILRPAKTPSLFGDEDAASEKSDKSIPYWAR